MGRSSGPGRARRPGPLDGLGYLQRLRDGILPGEGTVTIESRIVRQGRRVIVAQAEMRSAAGKLCANASATCMPG